FSGSGSGFYFRPSLGGQSIELQHFSGVGVVRASTAARAAMSGHTPSSAEAAALQDISEVLGAEQFVSGLSGGDPAINENAVADYLESWLGGSLIPHLHAAMGTSDPSVAEGAIAEYLRWARTVQLLGLDD